MKKTIFFICLLAYTTITIAQTFQPNVIIKQSNITTGTNVEIGINLVNFPCLEPLQVDPNYALFQNANQLELVIAARGAALCNPIPIDNPPYYFYDIGRLNEGSYNLQVRVVFFNTLLLPFANDGFLFGDIQNIQANIAVIPTLDFVGVFVFILLLLLVSKSTFNKKAQKVTTVLILILFVNSVFAEKVFHVLLSPDKNAPSPEAVVAESNISPPPPQTLLSSFEAIRPNSVKYVITERPTGDLASFIEAHPKWALSRLYRYIVVLYDDSVDEIQLKNTLSQDQYIDGAIYLTQDSVPTISAPPPNVLDNNTKSITNIKGLGTGIVNSYLNDLEIPSAWELSEGSGYIGAVDTGIEIEHSAFKTFDSNGNYLGGNFLEGFYQIDFGEGDLNVDEQQPVAITVDQLACEDPNNPGFALPRFVGHGTHISGILAANNSVSSENGICKNCGLSVMKYYRNTVCGSYLGQPSFGSPFPDFERAGNIIDSMKTLSSIGVGVISYSGGIPNAPANFCENLPVTDPEYPFCVVIDFLTHRNSLLVAAAGNNRGTLQFPASDKRVVAAGGVSSNGLFWNESPGPGTPNDPQGVTDSSSSTMNCPYSPSNDECGSTHSFSVVTARTDVVTQAKAVHSTFYTGGEWNPVFGCTDSDDNNSNDGLGNCTGTSMSTPQTSAILQLMRSTLPLLPNGDYNPNNLTGLINVLNATATSNTGLTEHNPYYGYGLPNARKALETLLGKSNGVQLKNRLSPMFAMYSAGYNNHIYSTFPQVATAFLTINGDFYIPDTNAPLVNEFTDFWYDHNDQEVGAIPVQFPAPRAEFYVFTTNNNPFTGVKNMIPLRRMEKSVAGNRNDTYAISAAEIQSFHDDSYNYAGIEGYILPVCSPMPSCIPNGAIPLYRDEADNLNHKLVPTFTAPPNSTLLGYVYLNQDTDGDGLIDGQEIILGTNINNTDSDGDTIPDGVEYPPAGVPFSDPLVSDIIFQNGFE